jgi:type II secretory pathway pseudopilin PulG
MKPAAQGSGQALTLVEALVVIAVVAILAALLLPAHVPVRRPAYSKKAQIEAAQIVHAIHAYLTECGRFPVSSNAMSAAASSGQDFTFGTYGLQSGIKMPGGTYDVRALNAAGKPLSYQANNSEVMAVLLDVEFWPNAPTVPTVNRGHVMSPQKARYLNAAMTANTSSPGIGSDGVYRDPWGQPYIITIDLNGDGKTRDAFYRAPGISADQRDTNAPKRGLNGLMPAVVDGRTFYEANSPVVVWSAGADKMVAPGPGTSAIQGVNRDNVLSWK